MQEQSRTGASAAPSIHISFDSLDRGGRRILARQDIVFRGGVTSCLLGPSGVGKSSLLRLIAGLINQDDIAQNLIVIDENDSALNGLVTLMDQREQLLPWLDVLANVTFGDRLRGNKADFDQAHHLLNKVGLPDHTRAMPDSLSGGMRQRVQLARCLYEKRPIILMDEPFSRLDAFTRMELQDLTAELTEGHTVLLVTHDMDEAWKMGHDLYIQEKWDSPVAHLDAGQGITLPRSITSNEALAFRQLILERLSTRREQTA